MARKGGAKNITFAIYKLCRVTKFEDGFNCMFIRLYTTWLIIPVGTQSLETVSTRFQTPGSGIHRRVLPRPWGLGFETPGSALQVGRSVGP